MVKECSILLILGGFQVDKRHIKVIKWTYGLVLAILIQLLLRKLGIKLF